MVNPNLTQKEQEVLTPTELAKKLFQVVYFEGREKPRENDEPKIKVSETISRMSFYYEKIRNAVDYKEEHLLKKDAINRILRRQIVIEMLRDGNEIAANLLTELIRAGYLPNNKIPEERIGEIGRVVTKYLKLKDAALPHAGELDKKELADWLTGIAACEIEERLSENEVSRAVTSGMYDVLTANLALPEDSAYKKDQEIQSYISVYRNYLKADEDMISFLLFKYFIPNWLAADEELIKKTGASIVEFTKAIHRQTHHPLAVQMNKIVARYTVFMSILTEVIEDDPVAIYESLKADPKAFPRRIKEVCAKRYRSVKRKLWRAAVRSIIYLFLTKMLLVFILEIPVGQLLGETANTFALAINVSFPPLLLFIIVLFSRLPSDANTLRIVEGIEELVFVERGRGEPIKLRPPAPRSRAKNVVFSFLYAITFFISFGFVIWALDKINFHFISITIFLFFLALISFFSIRIRKRVRELMVIEERENIFGLLIDFFSVPVIAAGKWLSEKFSKLNVLVFILDFIIEAPFKLFVEIAEEWAKYVRERKEDVSQ